MKTSCYRTRLTSASRVGSLGRPSLELLSRLSGHSIIQSPRPRPGTGCRLRLASIRPRRPLSQQRLDSTIPRLGPAADSLMQYVVAVEVEHRPAGSMPFNQGRTSGFVKILGQPRSAQPIQAFQRCRQGSLSSSIAGSSRLIPSPLDLASRVCVTTAWEVVADCPRGGGLAIRK
jgi:hypothetical protein